MPLFCIHGIADHWMPDRIQMDPDLVRPPRANPYLEQGKRSRLLQHPIVGEGGPSTRGTDRHPGSSTGMSAYTEFDRSSLFR